MNRRRFITTTTAAGLGAALLPRAACGADPIKIGVLLPFSKAFAVLGENTFAGFKVLVLGNALPLYGWPRSWPCSTCCPTGA